MIYPHHSFIHIANNQKMHGKVGWMDESVVCIDELSTCKSVKYRDEWIDG